MRMKGLEDRRQQLQATLDALKTSVERNRMGQFATPYPLACDIIRSALEDVSVRPLRFLDPAFGTGSFFSALLSCVEGRPYSAQGFEIDKHYGTPSAELWCGTSLDLKAGDFTRLWPGNERDLADLLVCNPPYVRHHHLERNEKLRLQGEVVQHLGLRPSGLSGLYVYFMLLAHRWMAPGGTGVWLVPSEFMDVNYGSVLKKYLLEHVSLTRIHRFDPTDVQFADALVSSCVVWFRRKPADGAQGVEFTYGGSVCDPRTRCVVSRSELSGARRWTLFPSSRVSERSDGPTLGQFFRVKRGVATGKNDFFVIPESAARETGLPTRFLRPILPSPRVVPEVIEADPDGKPLSIPSLFLLDCKLPRETIAHSYPTLDVYLERGEAADIHVQYLCSRRQPWYSQEHREPTRFLCTYMGRSRNGAPPFRFLLNYSKAIATNVYLMLYPRQDALRGALADPAFAHRVWQALTSSAQESWQESGRVYGGGLHKVEPKELASLAVPSLAEILQQAGISTRDQLVLL